MSVFLILYHLFSLCHYPECCLLQSVHSLSVSHTLPSAGSVSLCPLLSSTVCPLSVSTSQCTVSWFCVTMSTAAFYSLSTVCEYLTLYRLLFLCHYVHCCLPQSVHCLSVLHTVPSLDSVSLCPLLPSRVCPLSVSTSHLTLIGSLSSSPLLPSTVCPLSVSTSHFTVYWLFVIMSTAAFYSLSTVCQYLTPHLNWFFVIMSTAAFYSLSTVCQYLTPYRLLVLCHYVHCCLLQSVHCLSVSHTLPFIGSVSLCPLLFSSVCPLC